MTARMIGLGLILAGLLVGCSPTVAASSAQPVPPAPVVTTEIARPISVTIPRLQVQSSLIETGLLDDGVPEVPDVARPEQASWAGFSPVPGVPGPAVLYGHVDGAGRPGVFQRINTLKSGDEVQVQRTDRLVVFRVYRVEKVPKASLDALPDGSPSPTARRVYGDVDPPRPELRLITCGGSFDHSVRSYRDQVVVFAAEVPA